MSEPSVLSSQGIADLVHHQRERLAERRRLLHADDEPGGRTSPTPATAGSRSSSSVSSSHGNPRQRPNPFFRQPPSCPLTTDSLRWQSQRSPSHRSTGFEVQLKGRIRPPSITQWKLGAPPSTCSVSSGGGGAEEDRGVPISYPLAEIGGPDYAGACVHPSSRPLTIGALRLNASTAVSDHVPSPRSPATALSSPAWTASSCSTTPAAKRGLFFDARCRMGGSLSRAAVDPFHFGIKALFLTSERFRRKARILEDVADRWAAHRATELDGPTRMFGGIQTAAGTKNWLPADLLREVVAWVPAVVVVDASLTSEKYAESSVGSEPDRDAKLCGQPDFLALPAQDHEGKADSDTASDASSADGPSALSLPEPHRLIPVRYATIDPVRYYSLQDALSATVSGDVILIHRTVFLPSTLNIPTGRTVTLKGTSSSARITAGVNNSYPLISLASPPVRDDLPLRPQTVLNISRVSLSSDSLALRIDAEEPPAPDTTNLTETFSSLSHTPKPRTSRSASLPFVHQLSDVLFHPKHTRQPAHPPPPAVRAAPRRQPYRCPDFETNASLAVSLAKCDVQGGILQQGGCLRLHRVTLSAGTSAKGRATGWPYALVSSKARLLVSHSSIHGRNAACKFSGATALLEDTRVSAVLSSALLVNKDTTVCLCRVDVASAALEDLVPVAPEVQLSALGTKFYVRDSKFGPSAVCCVKVMSEGTAPLPAAQVAAPGVAVFEGTEFITAGASAVAVSLPHSDARLAMTFRENVFLGPGTGLLAPLPDPSYTLSLEDNTFEQPLATAIPNAGSLPRLDVGSNRFTLRL
ncbi:hypothetical protein DIPPA_22594 [Diplonema papillatum]|nr:hypothetical protein DIPPA_22594 [Diplonema papillatum]